MENGYQKEILIMKIGVVLRAFAREGVSSSVTLEQVGQVLSRTNSLCHDEQLRMESYMVDVVIPVNAAHIDHDNGKTAKLLGSGLPFHCNFRIFTSQADLFSGIVNQAMARQLRDGCTHSLCISSSCASFITPKNLWALCYACENGAKAAGLILPGMEKFIGEGCLTNTFAMWELIPLFTVGGFDMQMANRWKDDARNQYRMVGEERVPLTGLEIPTIWRLINLFGPCIAPIIPVGDGEWKRPDPEKDLEGVAREEAKMRSKFVRHIAVAEHFGFDLAEIKAGILPGYPK